MFWKKIIDNNAGSIMPFKKGQSGNPNGRAKKQREVEYSTAIKSACTPERWLRICEVATSQAERGDEKARKWLSDNLVGLPVQKNEITGADGGNIKISVKLKHGEEL